VLERLIISYEGLKLLKQGVCIMDERTIDTEKTMKPGWDTEKQKENLIALFTEYVPDDDGIKKKIFVALLNAAIDSAHEEGQIKGQITAMDILKSSFPDHGDEQREQETRRILETNEKAQKHHEIASLDDIPI
jgi:hypothetical protein